MTTDTDGTTVVDEAVDDEAPWFPEMPEVPRRRRASDIGRLVVAGAVFVLLGWAASRRPAFDIRLGVFFDGMPDWIRTIAWLAYTGSGIAALVLLAAAVASSSVRRGVVRDVLSALLVGFVLALIAGRAATGTWPHVLPEIAELTGELPYPTTRPTLVLIVVLVLGSYANGGVQRLMRWMGASVLVAPLVLGLSSFTGVCGAASLALLSVAVVRLAFGSPEGLPSLDRLIRALEQKGVVLPDLAYLEEQPGTVGRATGHTPDGRAVVVKVYGRDAANRQRAERVWRALWYRPAGPSPRAGRDEQAQHEALAVLSARAAEVNVPGLVGAGQTADGDVILAVDAPSGTAIESAGELTDADLDSIWRELHELHNGAHLTHGSIRPDTVGVDGDRGELRDLSNASLMPTAQQRSTDLVSMLATQAIAVGADRAVAAALRSWPPAELEEALPYAQAAVLDPVLRRDLDDHDFDIENLGEQLAGALEVEAPEPAAVKRVSWSDVLIVVAGIFAANALISQITDVGFDTLLDELRNASAGWLVMAFIINLLAYGTAYFALKAVIERPLPFFPTALLQSAKSFVGLVVPSMVGRVGLDIRYLQVSGVPVVVASTQGPVIGFLGFIAEVTLLALSAWAIGQELETGELGDFDGGGLVAIAIVVVVVGLVVVVAVPSLRERVIPVVREAVGSVRAIVSSPSKLLRIYGSELADRLIKALALGATAAAFGADLPFAALIFVSVGTGLLAGLAPVPGGIGVAEATMSGLLTATGLPPEQSVSIAIVHRVVTSYLPPVLGFFSFNWLNEKGYL